MYEMQTTVKQIVIFYNRLLISRNQMQFPITGALQNSWSNNIHGPRKNITVDKKNEGKECDSSGIRTHDLQIRSLTLYPLRYAITCDFLFWLFELLISV